MSSANLTFLREKNSLIIRISYKAIPQKMKSPKRKRKKRKKIRKKQLSPTPLIITKTMMTMRILGILILRRKNRKSNQLSKKQRKQQPLDSKRKKTHLIKNQKQLLTTIWMICNLGLTLTDRCHHHKLNRLQRMKRRIYHRW